MPCRRRVCRRRRRNHNHVGGRECPRAGHQHAAGDACVALWLGRCSVACRQGVSKQVLSNGAPGAARQAQGAAAQLQSNYALGPGIGGTSTHGRVRGQRWSGGWHTWVRQLMRSGCRAARALERGPLGPHTAETALQCGSVRGPIGGASAAWHACAGKQKSRRAGYTYCIVWAIWGTGMLSGAWVSLRGAAVLQSGGCRAHHARRL